MRLHILSQLFIPTGHHVKVWKCDLFDQWEQHVVYPGVSWLSSGCIYVFNFWPPATASLQLVSLRLTHSLASHLLINFHSGFTFSLKPSKSLCCLIFFICFHCCVIATLEVLKTLGAPHTLSAVTVFVLCTFSCCWRQQHHLTQADTFALGLCSFLLEINKVN